MIRRRIYCRTVNRHQNTSAQRARGRARWTSVAKVLSLPHELAAGEDLAGRPSELSKARAQSACENNENSRSDSEGSLGSRSHSQHSGASQDEGGDDFVQEVPPHYSAFSLSLLLSLLVSQAYRRRFVPAPSNLRWNVQQDRRPRATRFAERQRHTDRPCSSAGPLCPAGTVCRCCRVRTPCDD